MTNDDERDIFQLLGEAASAKGAGLSDASRDRLRGSVASFVRENPPAEGVTVRPFCRPGAVCLPWMTFFMAEVKASPAFLVLLVAIFFGGGISYAAEGALPGDSLYWVKTDVNEEVGDWLVAGEAQLGWDARKVERRLDETTILAAEGRLDAQAESDAADRVEKSYKRFAERAKEISEEDPALAVAAGADVEATLRAHGIVIQEVDGEDADRFAGRTLGWADAAVLARSEAEAGAEGDELRIAAERKAAAASERIEAARLAAADTDVSASIQARAAAQLKLATEAYSAGLVQASSSDYRASFGSCQRAHQLAQESKLLLVAAAIDDPDADGDGPGEGKKDDGDEDDRPATTTGAKATVKVKFGGSALAPVVSEATGTVQVQVEEEEEEEEEGADEVAPKDEDAKDATQTKSDSGASGSGSVKVNVGGSGASVSTGGSVGVTVGI